MQFTLEIFDNATECIEHEVRFEAGGDEVAECLGLDAFVAHRVYRLDAADVVRVERRFQLRLPEGAEIVMLRARNRSLDELPYRLHTNRELKMMLSATKPLSAFCGQYPPHSDVEEIPERLFDPHVEAGRFVKREYVEPLRDGPVRGIYHVLYALPAESWRIDAYILMQDEAARAGWNEGFERMQGSLLGYECWQNDIHVAQMRKRAGERK
jgi:hypothetical protein